jgi:hypothetical protein
MITRRTAASRVTSLVSVPLPGLAVFAVLAVLATLAVAGCGTAASSSASPGSGTKTSASAAPTATPAQVPPIPSATPPVTVRVPGFPPCTGWPQHVASGPLPASFRPVAVIRCVTIPGKGGRLVATMQRADKNLTALISALRRPSARMHPGIICPAFLVSVPPIVLISGNGSMISPKIPVNECGEVQQQVIAALATLPWKTVSVRLLPPAESS